MSPLPIETDRVLERGKAIMEVLGSFWTDLHADKAFWRAYGRGLGEFLAQRYIDFLGAVRSLSRKTCPIFRSTTWRKVTIRQSNLRASNAGILRYGDQAFFNLSDTSLDTYTYGGQGPNRAVMADVQPELVSISVLASAPLAPKVALAGGTDFWVDRELSAIVFRRDPFTEPDMPIVDILNENGQVADRELSFWGYNNLDDLEDVSNRYGILLGMTGASTVQLRGAINAFMDSFVRGSAMLYLSRLLCHMAGIPCCRLDEERVTEIAYPGDSLVIATDKSVYTFHASATPTVTVGQILRQGQTLTDTVQILRSRHDLLTGLDAFPMTKAFGRRFDPPLLVPNRAMPYTTSTVDDATRIYQLLWNDADLSGWYWDEVHARGVTMGTTLAEALGDDLPTLINPGQLLLDECRGTIMAVKFKRDHFLEGGLFDVILPVLRKILPPRMSCICVVDDGGVLGYDIA